MARVKRKIQYVCQECGADYPKWSGRCTACGTWNSLVEFQVSSRQKGSSPTLQPAAEPVVLAHVASDSGDRRPINLSEFDRVLGGGILPGAVILLGGEPGIGKSTLLLQVAHRYAELYGPVLYVSGEESPAQVRLRAERLKALSERILIVGETDVAHVQQHIEKINPQLVIVDSIQTMATVDIDGLPGSLTQVREAAAVFQRLAKEKGIPVFLVGHVTKQGGLAGPKVLEHIVDVVLQFDGERYTQHRMLRTVKNRFGATSELGLFEMSDAGLMPIADPSGALLAERPVGIPGSVVVCSQEGSRALLVEIQALVGPTAFGGTPRRQVSGVDYSRSSIVLAVLERRNGLQLHTHDVYLNVAGGIRLEEPAADLGIAVAVASALRSRPVDQETVIFGEIGLAGEVRAVANAAARTQEAVRLGFRRCVLPAGNMKGLKVPERLELIPVTTVADALAAAMSS